MKRRSFLLSAGSVTAGGIWFLQPMRQDDSASPTWHQPVDHGTYSSPWYYDSPTITADGNTIRGEFRVKNSMAEPKDYTGGLLIYDADRHLIRDEWTTDPMSVEPEGWVDVSAEIYTVKRPGTFTVVTQQERVLGEVELLQGNETRAGQ